MKPSSLRILLISSLLTLLALPISGHTRATSNAYEMPEFNLPDLNATKHSLSEWKGKIVLLNFWATWCPPCQKEMPYLVNLQKKYKQQGLQVVSVGLDDKRKLANFARTMHLNFPVLVAHPREDLKLLPIWGNRQGILPFTVVIAPDGHMKFMRIGEFDQEVFDVYVKPMLKKPNK